MMKSLLTCLLYIDLAQVAQQNIVQTYNYWFSGHLGAAESNSTHNVDMLLLLKLINANSAR